MKTLLTELVRAVRGRRSQAKINKKLGYSFNQIYNWESAHVQPSWIDFVRLCAVCGVDLKAVLSNLFSFQGDAAQCAELLRAIAPAYEIKRIAASCKTSVSRVRRWTAGDSVPKLANILQLIDAVFLLERFIELLVGPDRVPSMTAAIGKHAVHRQLHRRFPFTGAMLHALECANARRSAAGLASMLGIDLTTVTEAIREAADAGLVTTRGHSLQAAEADVNFAGDFTAMQAPSIYWLRRALKYKESLTTQPATREDFFGYLVFPTNPASRKLVLEAYAAFFAKARMIADEATGPFDAVSVVSAQYFDPGRCK